MSSMPPPPPPPSMPPPGPPGGYGGYGGYGGPPPGPKPSNYLPWAIVTTLLCCLPAGVVSIVYAAQVDGKWSRGDYSGAMQSSKNARTWAIVSGTIGLVVGVIYLIAIVAASSGN